MELLESPVTVVRHLVLDCCFCAGHGGGREGGGEDEAWGERADGVDHFHRACDVEANADVGFPQGSGDNVDAFHDCSLRISSGVSVVVKMFCDAGAVGSVHTDGMDFVEKGDGAVFLSQVADLGDRADGTTHAVDTFEGDDFGDITG